MKLEGSYQKNLNVDQTWVYGNSFKNSLVAVVVPSAKLKGWATANGGQAWAGERGQEGGRAMTHPPPHTHAHTHTHAHIP